jgi:hypothetical protein
LGYKIAHECQGYQNHDWQKRINIDTPQTDEYKQCSKCAEKFCTIEG